MVETIFSTVAGGNTVTSLIKLLQQGFFAWSFLKFLEQLFFRTHLYTHPSLLYRDEKS